MSKLIFSPDGTILLHWFEAAKSRWSVTDSLAPSFKTGIDVWDIHSYQFLYHARGYLVGMSDNGQTFLTQTAEDNFLVVETAGGNTFPLEKGVAEDYSTLHHRFCLSQDTHLCDVFSEYPLRKVSLPDLVTNMTLGPYLFIAFWFDWGEGIEGAYGQAVDLLTGEVSYTFGVNRHAVYVPIHYSTTHNMLFIGQELAAYDLATGEKLDDEDDNNVVRKVQKTVKKVGRKINGIGFHPDGNQLVFSLDRGVIEIWDMSKRQRLKTVTKPR